MFRFGDPGGRMYTNVGSVQVNLLAHWTSVVNGSNFTVFANGGRLGGTSLRITTVGNLTELRVRKTLDAQPTWGIAFGYRTSAAPLSAIQITSFLDGSSPQVDIRMNPNLTLSVTRNGTILGTSTSALSVNSYSHLELKVTIHSTAGAIELRRNGVPIIGPLTNINTQNTANSSANVVTIGCDNTVGNGASGNWDYDDIIVYDGQATDANGLADITGPIGDCALNWILPTAAGSLAQWIPDSGANYARVNEALPDADVSYVSESTVGDIDLYTMADLPPTATIIKSIAVCHFARRADAGSRAICAEIRTGATNYAHPTPVNLGTSYQYDFSNWGTNPNTGVAWTMADINALEVGQKVLS